MADQNKNDKVSQASGSSTDRMKKAAATRAITRAKLDKLSPAMQYAHSKVSSCKRAIDELQAHIQDGGAISPEMLGHVAALESELGKCLFGIH